MFNRLWSKWDPVHWEGCGVPQNGQNDLELEHYARNGGPVLREGYGVPQNKGNGLVFEGLWSKQGPVDQRGVAYRKMEETDLCWSATVETGVLFIGRGVGHRKTGLHRYCSSTLSTSSSLHGLLFIHRRPPPASTCDYSSTSSCSSSVHRSSTGYCSTSPLHGVLFNHPTTGYCSSSPPPTTVQPALHGVLFIQPSTGVLFIHRLDRSGYCSSSGNDL